MYGGGGNLLCACVLGMHVINESKKRIYFVSIFASL